MIDPIYGGVSASLSLRGDINIAEPKALVGFTGVLSMVIGSVWVHKTSNFIL